MPQIYVYTEPPPLPAGIPLRIYSNPICPYAQRIRLIAAAKNIPTQEINIHLKVKPDWFIPKITPYGQVPVIEHEGKLIRESAVGFDYIDEVFGGKSLWPTDPYHKAMGKLLLTEFGNKFIPNYYKFYRGQEDENSIGELAKFVQRLESLLQFKKTGFLSAETHPAAVDLLLWPWFERLGAIKILKPKTAEVFSEEKFPLLHGWITRMKQTDAVKASLLSDEAHVAFMKGVLETGQHDYSPADRTGEGVTIYTKKQ